MDPLRRREQLQPLTGLPSTSNRSEIETSNKNRPASLVEPSRPFTPLDASRRLLHADHYSNRPSTASLGPLVGPVPIRPLPPDPLARSLNSMALRDAKPSLPSDPTGRKRGTGAALPRIMMMMTTTQQQQQQQQQQQPGQYPPPPLHHNHPMPSMRPPPPPSSSSSSAANSLPRMNRPTTRYEASSTASLFDDLIDGNGTTLINVEENAKPGKRTPVAPPLPAWLAEIESILLHMEEAPDKVVALDALLVQHCGTKFVSFSRSLSTLLPSFLVQDETSGAETRCLSFGECLEDQLGRLLRDGGGIGASQDVMLTTATCAVWVACVSLSPHTLPESSDNNDGSFDGSLIPPPPPLASSSRRRVASTMALLRNACRVLFQLSKDAKLDASFPLPRLLDCLVLLVEGSSGSNDATAASSSVLLESAVYLAGCVKNASSSDVHHPTSSSDVHHYQRTLSIPKLNSLLSRVLDHMTTHERWIQLGVQITSTLRNLCSTAGQARACLAAGTIPLLFNALKSIEPQGTTELLLQVVRVLSKLVLVEECVDAMCIDVTNASALLTTMQNKEKQVAIRAAFVLGVMTAVGSNVVSFRSKCRSMSLDPLITLLIDEKQGELLLRVVRVVANLAIDPVMGSALAADARVATALYTLALNISMINDDEEELALNVLCAMTNLSYYQQGKNCLLEGHVADLIRHALFPALVSPNQEGVLEAVRCLGNLSRLGDIQSILIEGPGVLDALLLLLAHANQGIVLGTVGALINVTGQAAGARRVRAGLEAMIDGYERGGSDGVMDASWCIAFSKLLIHVLQPEEAVIGIASAERLVLMLEAVRHDDLAWEGGAGVVAEARGLADRLLLLVQRRVVMDDDDENEEADCPLEPLEGENEEEG